MIEIRHVDYSSINAEGNEINGEAVNAIYIDDNSLWITSEPFDTENTTHEVKVKVDLTDYQSALESATDQENLVKIWRDIPKEHQNALLETATQVKARLS